jgi:glycerol-3-phosphate dehydrogenase
MKRDLLALTSKKFDLLIIGGGISGACVAHDAALRGLSVALVEMKDFGWATSSATSKLIHGGLRYLKNLEFGLVRESLRERRTMEIIAPHQVYPLPFLVPTYKNTANARILIYPGMFLYDILSFDKAHLKDPARQIPHFQLLSVNDVLEIEPNVTQEDLTGGAIYYDCQMYSPERLTLAFCQSAAKNGATLANYTKVDQLIIENKKVLGAKFTDQLTGQTAEIKAKITLNVTGPWADFVSGLADSESKKKIVRSEGIHLITKSLVNEHAVVYRTKSGRHFFIIPWRGKSLIGTTDTKYEGSPDEYHVEKANILKFLDEINESHPAANLSFEDVDFAFGGLRPIVEDETDVDVDVYEKSRKYEIYDHSTGKEGIDNFITVLGGKYTTSRSLAENLVDKVFNKLNMEYPDCVTETTPVSGGDFDHWVDLIAQSIEDFPDIPENVRLNILHSYGSEYAAVLSLIEENPELANPVTAGSDIILAQAVFAAREEMAQTLEDFVKRRTDLILVNKPTKEELKIIEGVIGGAASKPPPKGHAPLESHD